MSSEKKMQPPDEKDWARWATALTFDDEWAVGETDKEIDRQTKTSALEYLKED